MYVVFFHLWLWLVARLILPRLVLTALATTHVANVFVRDNEEVARRSKAACVSWALFGVADTCNPFLDQGHFESHLLVPTGVLSIALTAYFGVRAFSQ